MKMKAVKCQIGHFKRYINKLESDENSVSSNDCEFLQNRLLAISRVLTDDSDPDSTDNIITPSSSFLNLNRWKWSFSSIFKAKSSGWLNCLSQYSKAENLDWGKIVPLSHKPATEWSFFFFKLTL